MKRAGSLLALLVLSQLLAAQSSANESQVATFERLCGRLIHAGPVPAGAWEMHSIKTHPLTKVRLDLFEWKDGTSCCNGWTLVESVITQRNGEFEFRNAVPGRYFVVAHWKGKTPALEVKVQSEKKDDPSTCFGRGLVIDSQGELCKLLEVPNN